MIRRPDLRNRLDSTAHVGWIVVAVLSWLLLLHATALAQPETQQPIKQPATLYFFWGDGCPHCEAAKPFLAELEVRYPTLEVQSFEVWYNADNRELLQIFAEAYNTDVGGVPAIFVGKQVWVGYAEHIQAEIDNQVGLCVNIGCSSLYQSEDAATLDTVTLDAETSDTSVLSDTSILNAITSENAVTSEGASTTSTSATSATSTSTSSTQLRLPFIGVVELAAQPLLLTTVLIAFIDGFNPCSLWVLSILLAMVLHAGSRRKVFTVGITFLLVTASVYGLFIAGVFSTLSYVGYLRQVQIAVAVIALTMAAINIKDYVAFKQGPSLTISDKYKPGLYKGMRGILQMQTSTWGMIATTTTLALGVTLVELPCTAGFPVIWSGLLAGSVSGMRFGSLLAVYLLVYLLDELFVFSGVVITLRASRLQDAQGRVLKLIGGMVMLALAVAMLAYPEAMRSLTGALAVFGMALVGTVVMMIGYRVYQLIHHQRTSKRHKHASKSHKHRKVRPSHR
ncbi:MAG: hypothetical protein AAF267_19745 [Deinococcota bacterium]